MISFDCAWYVDIFLSSIYLAIVTDTEHFILSLDT